MNSRSELSASTLTLSLTWGGQVAGDMIRRDAGSVSPSPRFAESAQQNGERAGVRCFVIHTLPVTTQPHVLFASAAQGGGIIRKTWN